ELGDAEIKATVSFTDDYPRYVAVFNTVNGKSTPFVTKHDYDADPVKVGKRVNYYVNPADIMIFDPETGEKALAVLPITDNTVMAKAAVKEGVVTLSVGKNSKISFIDGTGTYIDGTYAVRLGYKDIQISPEAVKANPKSTIQGKIEEIDVLGDTTALFVKVDGFDPYLTAVVDGVPKLNVGDKIKLVFNPENIVIVEAPFVIEEPEDEETTDEE
ncbi:MAG: TOBE domain-containing protein, partial [Clostridia bacterium]|nr:TOBE domain-containing protein [Clostridia bacterium]